jgi:Zn finger protein HypA/HybF involved in hydrogenase expression
MDDFERASLHETKDRELRIREQLEKSKTQPATECADCDVELEPHRHEFGTCIECQTARENRARLYRKG